MLVTSFEAWCRMLMQKIVDVGDQKGHHGDQHIKVVTNKFHVKRQGNRKYIRLGYSDFS